MEGGLGIVLTWWESVLSKFLDVVFLCYVCREKGKLTLKTVHVYIIQSIPKIVQ